MADLRAAFDGLDADKKGSIDKAQFAAFLAGHAEHKDKAQEIADKAFERVGGDSINFEQFSNIVTALKEKAGK